MLIKLKNLINFINDIQQLPKVKIKFLNSDNNRDNYKKVYSYFTKRHRLKLIQNKTIGVALIDLNLYKNFEDYYRCINGKNSAAYYSRKASKRGYQFVEIDRNNYIDDIYEINTSTEIRQGKRMSNAYLSKIEKYNNESNYRYFGVLNNEKKLVSYCNIAFYGEFALVVALLGHKKYLNDGIMYLMMIEVNKILFEEYKPKGYKYVMYDTFFGASKGLKNFKKKLGYKPYRVKWEWED